MADLEKIVNIIFAGEDRITAASKQALNSMNSFSAGAEKVAAPFASITDGILKADAALAAMVAGGLAYSISSFASFEDKMLSIKGIMGASQEQYEQLTELTLRLGETTKFTAREAAEGLEFLAVAGMSFEDSMASLPEVLKISQAAALDLGKTADIVTNIMAGYGIETKDLAATNDVLVATFTNSNTNLQQLGNAFKFVGPVAKSLGFDITETSAALGILGNAGYQAEMGGTALRNIMLALVAPAGNMGKLMKELGVETSELGIDFASSRNALDSLGVKIKDASGNILPFSNILGQIKTGLDKIPDAADRTATLVEIFGKRGGPQLAALLEQGIPAVEGLQDKIKSLGGVTDKIAKEMESGIGGALRSLLSAFESIGLSIGKQFSEGAADAAGGVTDVFRAISREIKDKESVFNDFYALFNDFGEELGKLFKEIAKVLPDALDLVDFEPLLKELDGIGGEISEFFDGMDLETPEGLAVVFQKVVDTITSLVRITSGIAEQFKPVFNAISEGINQVNDMDSETAKAFGQILGSAKLVVSAGAEIAGAFFIIQQSGAEMRNVFDAIFGSVKVAWNSVQIIFDSFAKQMTKNALSIIKDLQFFAKLPGVPKEWRDSLENAKATLEDFKTGIDLDQQKQFADLFDGAAQAMKGFAGETKEATQEVDNVNESLEKVGEDAGLSLDDFNAKLKESGESLTEINEKGELTVSAKVDSVSIDKAEQALGELVGYTEAGKPIYLKPTVDDKAVKESKEKIEKDIPSEKQLEIQTKIDIAEIEATTERFKSFNETVQTQVEWKAKLDIAEVESNTKIVEAELAALSGAFSDASDIIGSSLGILGGLDFSSAGAIDVFREITKQIEFQNELQEKALDMEIELSKLTAEKIRAQTQLLKSGKPLYAVTVDGSNLTIEYQALLEGLLKNIELKMSNQELLLA